MNSYFVDVGWQSHNKYGELLCGDHVEIVRGFEDSTVIVLADGLGSGVKANILSTLTSKIISTMIASAMSIEDCVSAVTATLPVCDLRQIAYSTFTIIKIDRDLQAEIIQFDNPHVILLRDGKSNFYKEIVENIDGKLIYKTQIKLRENDTFIAMSDGVIHAGVGKTLNFGWLREDVIDFMERMYENDHSAKVLTTILSEQCHLLYEGKPGDDTTVCTVKIRKRNPVNLMIGPPSKPEDVNTMMSLFFSKDGRHIVCGGTTSQLASEFLKKPLTMKGIEYENPKVPPIAYIEGVDLVTEGVITMNMVLEFAKNHLNENDLYMDWSYGKDGASQIAKILIGEATDINFYVGRAMNPAHQNPDLPIGFNIKMRIVNELVEALRSMNKNVKVSYF